MLKKGRFSWLFGLFSLVFCRFSDIKRVVLCCFFWEYPRELPLPLSALPQLSLWIISTCKLRERSRCCPVPSIWESSAGSFLRFQSLLLYSRKSPPFLYGRKIRKILFYSVRKFRFFSVRSFGSSGAAPRFLVVPLEFLSSSLSEQRPFYILRKLRKFNFVYRPVNLWYTDLWTYHAE